MHNLSDAHYLDLAANAGQIYEKSGPLISFSPQSPGCSFSRLRLVLRRHASPAGTGAHRHRPFPSAL
jgi:hypothetical protein